jgi:hypothetical protein
MSQRIVASTAVFGLLTGILLIFLLVALTGCVTKVTREPTKYRFKDGIVYKEVKYHAIPAYDEKQWYHIAAKDALDNGVAKKMKLLPIDLNMDNPHPHILNQEQWAEDYHNEHPECSYSYYR